MKKGNPAAALAIIVSIFGAAGVVSLLPDARREQNLQARELPSTPALAMTGVAAPAASHPAIIDRLELSARVEPAVVPTATVSEIHAADSAVVVPLQFAGDAGTPPALSATPLSFLAAAAAPIAPEPAARDDRRMGAVPAAFDRTGSALAFAFKKTGAGVKTAVSMLTP